MRVLISQGQSALKLESSAGLTLHPNKIDDRNQVIQHVQSVTLRYGGYGAIMLPNGDRVASLTVDARQEDAPIRLHRRNETSWKAIGNYPNPLLITADAQGLAAVNPVGVERYVTSVVAHETWPTFHDEALKAQAIVARTFVLDQMLRSQQAAWDIGAGQAAQVYGGLRNDRIGQRADRAVKATNGLVCTYREGDRPRIFPTYYSAVCGGESQSASIFGKANDIPPLRGGVICNYCRIAPAGTYRWGPIQIDGAKVQARLIERYPRLAILGRLVNVDVIERTSTGRLRTLRAIGASGEHADMLAENFRLAVGPNEMKSTDCEIAFQHGQLLIRHGKGYGHGLGLCQWGAQGQALQGQRAGQIIRYYYPDCQIMRAY